MPVVSNPHDALFRAVFSDPANAEGELRAVLPAALSACIDWRTLRHEAGSFVDDELRARHTDVLMSATVAGRGVLLYLLLEHQSSADPLMALRMLRYCLRIWDRALQLEPARRTLPVVIPLVVHNGLTAWSGPRRLEELVDADDALRAALGELLPRHSFALDDLATLDEEALRERALSAIAEVGIFALGEARRSGDPAREGEAEQAAKRWAAAIDRLPLPLSGLDVLGVLLRYIQETTDVEPGALRAELALLGSRAEGAVMTRWQQMEQEAEARGEARGRAEGRAEALLRLLALKFGAVPEATAARVRAADLATLDRWTEAVLSAPSLEQALR